MQEPRQTFPDGFPLPTPTKDKNDRKAARRDTTCPLCLSSDRAKVGVDRKGNYYVTCGKCNSRTFGYTLASSRLLHAWYIAMREVPGFHAYVAQVIGTCAVEVDRRRKADKDISELIEKLRAKRLAEGENTLDPDPEDQLRRAKLGGRPPKKKAS